MANATHTRFLRSTRLPLLALTVLAVALSVVLPGFVPSASAAGSGQLNLVLAPINATNGNAITDASDGTNGNAITYRVQYSCTTAPCDNTRIQMSKAPADPNGLLPDGEWILKYSSWVAPAGGGSIGGTDSSGKLITLGNLAAGTAGTFTVTYAYQGSTPREIPNGSFYPEGFKIGMSATATSDTAVAPVTADAAKVTWHIGVPTGPTTTVLPSGGSFKADTPVTYVMGMDPGNVNAPGSCLSGMATVAAAGSYQVVYTAPPQAVIQSTTDGGVIDNVAHTVTWTSGTPAAPSYAARGGWGLAGTGGYNCGGPGVNNPLRATTDDDAFFRARSVTVTYPGANFPQADASGCNFSASLTSKLDVSVSYLDAATTQKTSTQSIPSTVACTSPFGGLTVDKRIYGGASNQFGFGDQNLGGNPEVYAVNVPGPGQTDAGNREWRVTASNLGNVDATAVIDDDLTTGSSDAMHVYRIYAYKYAGAPAGWRTTVNWTDNTGATGTASLADGAFVEATAGRWFTAAHSTAPVAAGRILPGDTTSTSVQVGYRFLVGSNAPIGGLRPNTAHVELDYPNDANADGTPDTYQDLSGNPLPAKSVSADASRTAQYTRATPRLVASFTGAPVVAGGGTPTVGTEVTYSMRASSDTVYPGSQIRPQLVFVAPAGWDIVPGSAQFGTDGDGTTASAPAGTTFDYATRTIGGVPRQVVVATWPALVTPSSSGSQNWPTMTVKAKPTSAAPAGTSVVAQVYAGDQSGAWRVATGSAAQTAPAQFRAAATPITDTPDVDGDGDVAESYASTNSAALIVGATDAIKVVKELCIPDATAGDGCHWVSDPSQPGVVPRAATVKYRITLQNAGNTALHNVVAYDVLPYPGDTGLLAGAGPRGSQFSMTLSAVTSVSTGVTVDYSPSTNPTRPEVDPGATGTVDDWGAGPAGKKALRIKVTGTLAANTAKQVEFTAAVAPGSAIGQVACNTAAIDTGETLPVEPLAVCVKLGEPIVYDFGDAPASYGTTLAGNGPQHTVADYASADHTSPVMLGSHIDGEADGAPSAAADGDDTAGVDDEDGVAFNPQLGYPSPTIRTGPDPITLEPVVNHLTVNASAAGFASVWVDWNQDGDFADAGERVADATPVTAGDNDVTFSQGTNPADIRTHVRVRYSTDSASVHAPTGAAPDGEVEDYRVLVERLVTPAACSPVTDPYYAFTFDHVTEQSGGGAPGTRARYVNAGVVRGEVVDVIIQTATGAGANTISSEGFTSAGDDIGWKLSTGAAVAVTVTFVKSGTTTPVSVNTVWTVNDMDPGERTDYIPTELAAGYAITPGSKVMVSSTPGGRLIFAGTEWSDGFPNSRYQVWFQNKSSIGSIWRGFANSGFGIDADGDIPVPKSCDDYGDAPDSYKTLLASDGPHHTVTAKLRLGADSEFDADGQPTVGADGDDTNRNDDEDGVGPITLTTGSPVGDIPVTVSNGTAGPATLAGWVDLDGSGTFDVDERAVATVPAGTVNGSVVLSFPGVVTTTQASYARFRLYPGTLADPLPTGAATGGEVEDYQATTLTPALEVTKTSDATADSKPGDVVTYTLTVHNGGTGDYTAAAPATVVDDLTGVLDDATYAGGASASSGSTSYAAPRLRWTGALAHGGTVTITYQVTLTGGGDGRVRNVAWQPTTPTPGPTPDCASSPLPCAEHESDLPKLTISKRSNRAQLPAAGQQIAYTVTVTNPGPGNYTVAHPATFEDDLSDVLDDATFDVGSITASVGSASMTGSTLGWSGVLAAGQSATVTYTATYQGTGDLVVDNKACVPAAEAQDPADRCRTVHTPGSGLRHSKQVDPRNGTPVSEGQVLTYTLTFENVGPADATVNTFDDLSDVVDDAGLVGGSVSADPGLDAVPNAAGDRIDVTGTVPTGQTLKVTYRVKVKRFADQGDHLITNALACEPGDPQPCDPTSTTNPVRHLTLTKTSDATVDSRPGNTVSYTVRLVNDGTGDYTALSPAALVDDLTGVLDDATYDGVAHASQGPDPAYFAPRISWSGPLAAGDEVRVTYEVVLKGGGDGEVANVAWAPTDPADPGATPDCAQTNAPCDTESFDLPKLTVAKSADRSDLPAPGQDLTYTVVVTNPGPGDYTAAHPATFSDDLSDVLDDATAGAVTASTGAASITGSRLSWSGVLAAGDSTTITYTVTYRATGDHVLDNTACVPAAEAQDPTEDCDSVSVPGSGLVHAKSVSPASGTPVEVGQVVTYTLTFDNSAGHTSATVDTSDDLSAVLDDATLDAASVVAGAGLSAASSGTDLLVTGSVPAGATRTVTYQVAVKAFAQQGDHVLTNALACEPGEPAPCAPETTTNPVRHVVLTKTSTAPLAPDTGDRVTYTVTAHNDGAGDWTAADPASVEDDLSDVLDDATWDGAASATSGGLSFTSPKLGWSGALAHGDTVTITYSVTVTDLGDHDLANKASVVGCRLPECTPAAVVARLPHVVPAKSSAPADGSPVQPGQTVTYTLSWTNDGQAPGVVDSTDDLTGVLDDADVVTEPASSDPAVHAVRTGTSLRVTGPIADGDTVTVTYAVRVKPSGQHGDDRLANVLAADTPQVACPPYPCTPVAPSRVDHPVGDLDDWKSVDPASGTPVEQGAQLTYTLHFTNVGNGPVQVAREDDLSGVLDDAVLIGAPASSSPSLKVAGPTAARLSIVGSLPAGTTATVTYTVRIKADRQRGDDVLTNFLLDPGQATPGSCSVVARALARTDCTLNRVAESGFDLQLVKKVAGSTKVRPGGRVTYRLRVSNRGPGAASSPIVVRDPLPAGLELVSAHGRGWHCTVRRASDKVTCRRASALPAHRHAQPIVVVATVAAGASGRIVNTATVQAHGDVSPANNRDAAPIRVTTPALPHTGYRLPAGASPSLWW